MSNANRGVRTFALALILGLVFIAPHTASAGPATLELPLINYSLTNPCNGTNVIVNGTQYLTVYTKANASGGLNIAVRVRNQGTGDAYDPFNTLVLSSYTYHGEENVQFNGLGSGANELTILSKTMLIHPGEVGPGVGDDFLMKSTIHLTIPATGDPSASVISASAACPGAE